MKLKTFQAATMAEALSAVRKDLGNDAMILHTRSYKVGAWLGFGGRNMVEITASAAEGSGKMRRGARAGQSDNRVPAADDRAQVLGAETAASRHTGTAPVSRTSRDPAEIVVQRASHVVEPKPIISQPDARPVSRLGGTADTPTPSASDAKPRPSIATRLPKREGAAPVRLADATPPPDQTPAAPRSDAPANPVEARAGNRVLDGFRRSDAPRTGAGSPKRPLQEIPAPDPADLPSSPPSGTTTDGRLQDQIAGLEAMMGRVLETTRRTSIAMGRVAESAAEPANAGPLLGLTNQMVDNDTPIETVDQIVGRVRDRLDARELADATVVRQVLLREIEATIATKGDSLLAISGTTATGNPRVISLIGPTGVGKTTTVAKLAAACKLRHGKRVGLITSDTYRIAAVEQLRTYAGIIGLPIKVVMTPEEMSAAIDSLRAMDVIIVDTAGRSQHDGKRLEELRAFIDAASPDETHLVLSSTVGNRVLERTTEKFGPLSPDRVILTKLDEAVCTGHLTGLTARLGLPLSFVTVGQEVPDDIEPARADRLARLALDGPDALFGAADGRG
ncbi:MAG: flagellar biosynthesis protein FlhF [Planctomycetota bacterium]